MPDPDPIQGERPVTEVAGQQRFQRRHIVLVAFIGVAALLAIIFWRDTSRHDEPPPPPPPPARDQVDYPVIQPNSFPVPPPAPPPLLARPEPLPVSKMFEPPGHTDGKNRRISVFRTDFPPPPPPPPAPDPNAKDANSTKVAFAGKAIPGSRASKALDLRYTLMPDVYMCTLQTAIDTTVAGPFICNLDREARSPGYTDRAGNRVPGTSITLMEKGTRITGQYGEKNMQQGQSRIFANSVIAVTPNGVVVPLDSPIGDELGRAGFGGNVDNHLWERFGAGVLLMLTDNAFNMANSALQSRSGNGNSTTNFNLGGGGAQQIANTVLNQTINIPPTLTKNQGERIGIFIVSPIDFSDSYKIGSGR